MYSIPASVWMLCFVHYIGDIIVVCLRQPASYLKLESAVFPPGKDPVLPPVVTPRTTYALAPKEEEGSESWDKVRSWEGQFHSVNEFLKVKDCKGIPMPAVSVIYSANNYTVYVHTCISYNQAFTIFYNIQ